MSTFIDVVFQTLRAQIEEMTPDEQISYSQRLLSISPTPSIGSPSTSSAFAHSPVATNEIVMPKPNRRKAVRSRCAAKTRNDRSKKPVNAFMTFRAYISPALAGITQKNRSLLLSIMWRAELRKSQFNLLGAAFSKIRDSVSDCPSLEKFLAVAASKVNVIPPERYLELAGWRMSTDEQNNQTLQHAPVFSTDVLAKYPLQTNVSSQDIIQHCFHEGLISAMPETSLSPQPRPTLSFAALPQNHDNHDLRNSMSQAHGSLESNGTFSRVNLNEDSPVSVDINPSLDFVTQDQQTTYHNTPAIAHWMPASAQPPILGMDLTTIQDDFDPFSFEMDDFTNF